MGEQELTAQERALLAWLREVDDGHVSTGLLARAFEAGWTARAEGPQAPDLTAVPWRQGRRKGRNLYAVTGEDWEAHPEVGKMDTPELAASACEAHNAGLGVRAAKPGEGHDHYPGRGAAETAP